MSPPSDRQQGQVMIMFALSLIALLAGLSLVFDVGNQLIERRVAQNAADAGALAGVEALALPGATTTSVYNMVMTYIEGNTGPWTTTTTVSSACTTPIPDVCVTKLRFLAADGTDLGAFVAGGIMPSPAPGGILVEVTRTIPATFSRVLGIKTLTATGVATGASGVGPVDVMLALDTTGSMGSTGFAAEQKAVHDFIIAMHLVKGNANSVRIGIVRFQGAFCNDTNPDTDNNPDTPSSCYGGLSPKDDATVLTQLTDDPDALLTIACGNVADSHNQCLTNGVMDYASIPCSSLLLPLPLSLDGETFVSSPSGHVTPFGCPLAYICHGSGNCVPTEVVGTKLANSFNSMRGMLAGQSANSYWAFTDASRPSARKVLIMMTDGQDNSPMSDANITAAAQALKSYAGDNVTIYTLGYYEGAESTINVGSPPYACIGSVFPPTGITVSTTDQLMHDLSSSGANDCEFYAPMKKSDNSLPAAFVKIAGRIQAGRLAR